MSKILTVKEAKKLDKITCEKQGLTEIDLINRAGVGLYEYFSQNININGIKRIVIIAGPGNNGLDSLAMGTHICQYEECEVVIIACSKNENVFLKQLKKQEASIYYLDDLDEEKIKAIISKTNYLIDGIFGIGLNRDITNKYYQLIKIINESNAYVFSIDIPSGINGDNGLVSKIAVRADLTAVIEYFKPGNFLNDALDYHGKKVLISIGLEKADTFIHLLDPPFIFKRKHNTHKYNYGSILIFSGKMAGASLMSGLAALRCGSGLVAIAVNNKYLPFDYFINPEIIIQKFTKASDIDISKKDVIVFGPGLGKDDEDNIKILNKVKKKPLVIDADGLHYLKDIKHFKSHALIITPHMGELASLLNLKPFEVAQNPLEVIATIIRKYHCTIVLKGPCTIIANEKEVYFSPYGNPGMATAGSGDVLAGMIASFIGQGYDHFEAVKLGVYMHQLAGNIACDKYGEESLIATDIINAIPQAFKKIEKKL